MIRLLLIAIILFTTGCSKSKKETFHTVSFYRDNPKIRDVRITECKHMQEMTVTIKQDCRNAFKATRKPIKDIDLTKDWGKAR